MAEAISSGLSNSGASNMSTLDTRNLETISDFIRYAYSLMRKAGVYCGHGTDNPWDEAVQLVLLSLHLPWDFDQAMWYTRLSDEEQVLLTERLTRRIDERMPLPYLTNEAWFCGFPFYVDERVLVPRSPIAELIQSHFAPWLTDAEPQRILDLCTGSGCIGIACAMTFDEADVDLLDLSPDALAVAEKNVRAFDLNDRVHLLQSDLFSALRSDSDARYDLIVSNPPYVDARDLSSMPEEFGKEPVLGLAAGEDGLDIVRRILADAGRYLTEDGLLVVEVGNSWEALEAAYPDVSFMWVEFESGGHGVFVMTAAELNSRDW
jgi:ribosomal protein L3 glutamine methyltransferase